jgi:hypothetical protein
MQSPSFSPRNSGVSQRVHCTFRIARGTTATHVPEQINVRNLQKGSESSQRRHLLTIQSRRTTNYPHAAKCALASAVQVSKVRHLSRVASKVRHLIFLRSESQSGVSEKNLKARRRNNPVVPDEFVRLRPATTRSVVQRFKSSRFKVRATHPACSRTMRR